jgi:glycosyltransferase involved in cell wall biosynthesis
MVFNGKIDRLERIGFISTRIAGTDGVSLEIRKWAHVLEEMGYDCFYFGGELDTDPEKSTIVDEAHFAHPTIKSIYNRCFNNTKRHTSTSDEIHKLSRYLKGKLYGFVEHLGIQMLVVENALAIPLNVPLGLAITEFIAETCIPTIAHHHDFFWERKRFLVNAIWDYLNMAFPPHLNCIQHVVINSSADNQLSLRTGVSATLIPNVMDFDNPPQVDDYGNDVRQALGIAPDVLFVLQPTRIVKRKGIEHAIELLSRLDKRAKLVISHASGDEGYEYERRIRHFASLLNVETIFVSNMIKDHRGLAADGKKIYTLNDVYPHADLVTYPSSFEGFGNAFLEAIYFKKPIVVNNYTIYATDIKPKRFKVIEFDDYITDRVVSYTRRVIEDANVARGMVEHNFQLARQFYSYSLLKKRLELLIANFIGI